MLGVNPYPLLEQIARNQSGIKLLNIFKGLPISYDARINSIGGSEIQVRSNMYQLACLYFQRETYLLGEELPFILHSQVVGLHLGREEATLANLETAQKGIGERMQIRVEPESPLIMIVKFEGSASEFYALLADISAEGAGIYFEDYMFPSRLCQAGRTLSATLSLPDGISQKIRKPTRPLREGRVTGSLSQSELPKGQDGRVVITTQGKVVSVHPDFPLSRYRVGLRLFFKDLARAAVLQYIAQRQTEIIRDLGVLSDGLHNLKK
ncbi:MAG: hypothetical protein HND47_07320 [Chloroflexi bacterium]|nr:hypothetical protein [Chloroflexota bacterium]